MLRPTFAPLLVTTTLGLVAACASSSASAVPPKAQPGTQGPSTHAGTTPPVADGKAPADVLTAPKETAATPVKAEAPAEAAVAATDGGAAAEAPPPIEPKTVVLNVGDSFLMAGFSQTLRPKMNAVGAIYEMRSEQASYTTTWHLKLAKLVGDYHPDLVIINLGANEITLTDPPSRADAIRRLIKIVGDRPCVWVTPPLWRKDTGIIDIIRKNIAPCRLFDSDALVGQVSRQADGIHPDGPGGAIWAEAFWKWLEKERAPAPKPGEKVQGGSGRHAVNPWRLKPAPAQAAPATPPKTAQVSP